ncbi:MAG: flagellar secretion chaperone FliS [Thermosediminibacterales bacterium]|nr:flagellar secretion chaperone FliS [Thermosediminibacterales bacterium]MDK2836206.1 flagellar secretion chaperone FliS [Thermosediminibacterales bacterium]
MKSPLNIYKQNQIQTAPQEKLVLMLYDGAIKFITIAIKAIEEKDIETANTNLLRAQDIMTELMSGVNFEAGEVAKNFYTLYEYMHYRLMQANIKKDKNQAEEVLGMVKELRDTWAQMLKENKGIRDLNNRKKSITVSA